ncbi:MAG: Gfo/Idh/MocA family oxidoreductase [Treponema sp.]|jgi:predicted dehydrogenase|nr:Gfo/Idh/MocA family oxidoreductase [Treponema sp.]
MKIGTVGTNFIVDTFIEAAKKTGKAEIIAAYSRNPETDFAAKHGIPKRYSDREAFLNDGDIDFVYVAAPNSLHYAWCRDALASGRGVICEKPFVSRAGELEELIALAKKQGLFLFEALTVPHLPNFRLIKEKIPLIAPVRFAQLNFSQYSSRYDAFRAGKNPNLFNPAFSGGALMDLNYYNLSFAQRLFGSPAEIRYFANIAENGIDTSGLLVMRYGDFIAEAVATKDSDSRNFVQIQGEGGYISAGPAASNLRDGFTLVTKAGTESYNEQDCANVLYYELLDFIADFESGDRSRCDKALADALDTAVLMDKARQDAGIVFAADNGSV